MKEDKEKTLKDLEKELEKELKKVQEIKQKISELEKDIELPELKEKYEGKFFKYLNSYGDINQEWWIYVHCKEIKSDNEVIVSTFETEKYGSKFILDDIGFLTCFCEIEITEIEYNDELCKFIDNANKLFPDDIINKDIIDFRHQLIESMDFNNQISEKYKEANRILRDFNTHFMTRGYDIG